MNKLIRVSLGLGISGFCLWLVFRGFDFHKLKVALSQASPVWFVIFLILFTINQLIRTARWKIFLSPIMPIPLFSLFSVLLFGFFMNMVLPARGGEFVRGFAAHRKYGINLISTFGTIVAERMSDFLGLFLMLIISCRTLPLEKLPVRSLVSVFSLGLTLLILLVWFSKTNQNKNEGSSLKMRIIEAIHKGTEGFSALKSKKRICGVTALSFLVWINEALMVLIMSYAMGLNLNFIYSSAVIVGLSVGVMIPAGPGFIGTFEFFGTQILTLLGFDHANALNMILVLHFTQVVSISILGGLSSFFLKSSKKDLAIT